MPATLQLALLIAILLPASKLAASLCTRFGIPAILGELLVGVVAGPGAFDLMHASLFQGGQAAKCVLDAGAGRRPGSDVHCRPGNRYRTNARGKRHRIPGGFVRGHLALLPGSGRSACSRPALEQRALPGWRIDGYQRFHFSQNSDGRWKDVVARGLGHSRRCGNRRRYGLVCPCVPCGVHDNWHKRFFWLGCLGLQLVETAFGRSGAASPRGSNVAHRGLRSHLFYDFIWCGKALARSADPAIAKAFRQ